MGAWGSGPFENDDAGDWLFELEESPDASVISAALSHVIDADADELEAPEACNALAAAEVVAALNDHPLPDLPDNAREWVDEHEDVDASNLIPKALAAIQRIRKNSELKDLWDESKDSKKWYATLDDLVKRLNA
jgi:hypothetical protein